jgi:hypothetical protein
MSKEGASAPSFVVALWKKPYYNFNINVSG